MVSNHYLKPVGRIGERNLDVFRLVKFVAVLNRIGDRFADRKVDGGDEIVTKPSALGEFVRFDRRLID